MTFINEMHRLSPTYLKNKYPDRDKQYWVLCAIYRMVRVKRWSQDVAAKLLNTRAKYNTDKAKQIAAVWFGPGKHNVLTKH